MLRKEGKMEEIVSLIFVMGRLMRDKMHRKVVKGQCSLLEFETLRYVHDNRHPLMRDVAKNFHVTPPAATLLIDGMVKEKLLTRLFDPKDRRSVRISLTRKGERLLEAGITRKTSEFKKILGTLTQEEQKEFAMLLRKIIKTQS